LTARAADSEDTLPSGTIGVILEAGTATSFGATFDDLVTAVPAGS
jgi:hypothetical protein